jgi:uncharacterized protein (DUF1810 family)
MAFDAFKSAQASPSDGFAAAVQELASGRKTGHWIWYVFPQIRGLGYSSMSQSYALQDLPEAATYLRDPTLRSRLVQITQVVADRLKQGDQLPKLMGGKIDALKLVSSLTLFELAGRKLATGPDDQDAAGLLALFGQVLAIAETQGFPRCQFTLESVRPG